MDIGRHCSVPTCKLLDFLPFTCDGCGEIHCKDHKDYAAHSCSGKKIIYERPKYTGPKSFKCSLTDCKGKELSPVKCEECGQLFCLSHRHQSDHNCQQVKAPIPQKSSRPSVSTCVKSNPTTKAPKKSRKSEAVASKVALMKIKMKAVGDTNIPDVERTYLNVHLPMGTKEKTRPIFVAKTWSLGKILDDIASRCDLRNDNNLPAAKKMCLFNNQTGQRYDSSTLLATALADQDIFNGGSINIDYLSTEQD